MIRERLNIMSPFKGEGGYQMLRIDYEGGGGLANNYLIKYDLSKW